MKMKPIAILLLTIVLASACSQAKRDAERAKEDASAKARADAAKKEMEALPKVFSTPDYYKKNEARYNFYRWNCGRDQRLEQLWGKKESS